jgi:adenylylsulfate kinase
LTPHSIERLTRKEREANLRQHGKAIWLYGLSGAGKSTLANALERSLANAGFATILLDGDEIRSGLNSGLGFGEADRTENLRRSAEVARLLVQSGMITICAFITPLRSQRDMVRRIIGAPDLVDIFLDASFATCALRDPKGLYSQAAAARLPQFTGRDSAFEKPLAAEASLIVNTDTVSPTESLAQMQAFVGPHLGAAPGSRGKPTRP